MFENKFLINFNIHERMEHEKLIDMAYVAHELGFIPIIDDGKKPVMYNWNKIKEEDALHKIESFIETAKKSKKSKQYNIGIITGKVSSIVVLDVDKKGGGVVKFKKLLKENNCEDLHKKTFTVKTGGGGYHYYFKYDDVTAKLLSRPVKGIGDIKTNGGQVVFLGSIHPDTEATYYAYGGHEFDSESHIDIKLISMPKFLYTYIINH
jgi:hypothetical protein